MKAITIETLNLGPQTMMAKTGHTLSINKCKINNLPELEDGSIYNMNDYSSYYQVKNWDIHGNFFFSILKYKGKKEYHVLYGNGQMWSSCGSTIEEAVNGAIEDGWLYTR